MAADPVSPHKGSPEGVTDYFAVFGLERRFGIDREALTRRYYELARASHPDRVRGAMALQALERMSEVNQAYTALRDPELLREHLLKLEGFAPRPGGNPGLKSQLMPMELAETWFELQDAATEDPSGAAALLQGFEKQLSQALANEVEQIALAERRFDETRSVDRLAEIAKKLLTLNYLRSLERDTARVRERVARTAAG